MGEVPLYRSCSKIKTRTVDSEIVRFMEVGAPSWSVENASVSHTKTPPNVDVTSTRLSKVPIISFFSWPTGVPHP